jgi:hypothetical protein
LTVPKPDRRSHQIYGRTLVTNLPIPELRLAPCLDVRFSVTVAEGRLSGPAKWADVAVRADGREWIAVAEEDDVVWLRCRGSVLFSNRALGPELVEIVVSAPEDFPADTIRHMLLDDVIPALIARSGAVVLHGAAAVLHGGAVVVLGESGMGKSTLATVFALAGDPVLSDDCLVIDKVDDWFVVQPSYPSLRLWEQSAHFLLGPAAESQPFAHDSAKRRYDKGLAFAPSAMPLRGILRIDSGHDNRGGIEIHEVHGHAAGDAVVRGVKYALHGAGRSRALEHLLDLAGSVPVGRLTVPGDFEQLAAVREAVFAWSAQL